MQSKRSLKVELGTFQVCDEKLLINMTNLTNQLKGVLGRCNSLGPCERGGIGWKMRKSESNRILFV